MSLLSGVDDKLYFEIQSNAICLLLNFPNSYVKCDHCKIPFEFGNETTWGNGCICTKNEGNDPIFCNNGFTFCGRSECKPNVSEKTFVYCHQEEFICENEKICKECAYRCPWLDCEQWLCIYCKEKHSCEHSNNKKLQKTIKRKRNDDDDMIEIEELRQDVKKLKEQMSIIKCYLKKQRKNKMNKN